MKLTDHDLKQIDHSTLNRLSPEQVLSLSHQMIDDLKEARERLNQNSNNSSRPSGSMPPWTSSDTQNPSDPADQDNADTDDVDPVIQDPIDEHDDEHVSPEKVSLDSASDTLRLTDKQPPEEESPAPTLPIQPDPVKRVAGKQKGALGCGRT